jgi:hypothetical protein
VESGKYVSNITVPEFIVTRCLLLWKWGQIVIWKYWQFSEEQLDNNPYWLRFITVENEKSRLENEDRALDGDRIVELNNDEFCASKLDYNIWREYTFISHSLYALHPMVYKCKRIIDLF